MLVTKQAPNFTAKAYYQGKFKRCPWKIIVANGL